MNILTLCILALLPAGMALADEAEHREHGPHVHGVAELNVAPDGNVLWIELSSPAVNLVGFEHAPENAEQEAAVYEATATLQDGARVFGTSPDAGCELTDANVTTDIAQPGAEHHEEAEHGEDEHAGEAHSEFQASYRFDCAAPDALTQLGYVVPLETEGTALKEFLLVPYYGACIHVPPPPPNQTVFVRAKDGLSIRHLFDTVAVTGRFNTERRAGELADAGYVLDAAAIELVD